jgi:hypothetical protein
MEEFENRFFRYSRAEKRSGKSVFSVSLANQPSNQGTIEDMRQFRTPLLILFLFLSPLARADAVQLAPGHPERYVVQHGDTLWSIAGKFLSNPWQWPEIWQGNPGIHDPNLIYPGDELYLVFEGGKPRLSLERPKRTGPLEVKLSPGVRREALTRPVPTIPIDAINQFLTRPRVMSQEDIQASPQVNAFVAEHILGGQGDAFYVDSLEDPDQLKFDILRPGAAYRDPDTGENLGYEALFVGQADLLQAGTPAKLLLVSSQTEVQLGDRLLPDPEQEALNNFQPRPAPDFTEGRIIAVLNGVNQIGQLNVVVLNLGAEDDVEPGHVLSIRQRSRPPTSQSKGGLLRRAVELPLEEVGTLMVFRTFDRVSYALVMSAVSAIHVKDVVSGPVY